MRNKHYILTLLLLISASFSYAQKAERDHIRKGNSFFKDSVFTKAEIQYRKALEVNPKSGIAKYNLGNTLVNQSKFKDALKEYDEAAKLEKDKKNLSSIYHNSGVIYQGSKQYAKAVEAYKQSLRNDPTNDKTRYNLALAQKLLKQQQKQNKKNNKNKDKKKDKKDQKKNQDKQKNNNKNQKQPPKQQKNNKNKMSKKNAEQLLNSVMQDEKKVQKKLKKKKALRGRKLEKDW